MTLRLSPSRIRAWQKCPRYYHYVVELGETTPTSPASAIGKAIHAELAMIHSPCSSEERIALDEARIKARAALTPDDRVVSDAVIDNVSAWEDATTQTVLGMELDLISDEVVPGVELHGIIDMVYRRADGLIVVRDWKTTSRPGAGESIHLAMDPQLYVYYWLARYHGIMVDLVEHVVLHRPSLSRHRATPADQIRRKKDGTPYAGTRTEDESDSEYVARLRESMRPPAVFTRAILEHEDIAMRRDILDVATQIMSGARPRNGSACVGKYGVCPFYDRCATAAHLEERP